jgi:anti-anti-sigma factor
MTNYRIYLEDNSNICLEGDVVFNNVVKIRDSGIELMNAVSSVYIDLSEIKHVDSSSLALLIAWARAAKRQHKKFQLLNVPDFLASLARVSGLDAILAM